MNSLDLDVSQRRCMPLARFALAAVGISAMLVAGRARAEVRHKSSLVADPFTVSAGQSLGDIYADESSQVLVNGGTVSDDGGNLSRHPLRLADFAKANMTGGVIWTNVEFFGQGGDDAILLEDDSEIGISGGEVKATNVFAAALKSNFRSRVTITGGTFSTTHWDTIEISFLSSVDIAGGTFKGSDSLLDFGSWGSGKIRGGSFLATGSVNARGVTIGYGQLSFANASIQSSGQGIFLGNDSALTMLSGSITASQQGIRMLGGEANIYGGSIQGSLVDLSVGGGTMNLFVQSAKLNGSPLASGPVGNPSGTLAVRFVNGATENLSFSRTAGALNIVLIPEPTTCWLTILGLLPLVNSRGRSR